MGKKLIYISKARIPSLKANSINIISMCKAYSKIISEVILVSSFSNRNSDIRKFYDINDENLQFKHVKNLTGMLQRYGFTNLFFKIIYSLFVKIKLFNIETNSTIIHSRDSLTLLLFPRVETIYEIHSPPPNLVYLAVEKILLSRNNVRVLSITESLKKYYKKRNVCPKEKEISVFADCASDGSYTTSIRKKVFLVGYLGSLHKGRGIELIIEIARVLKEVKFLIIGGSSFQVSYWSNKNTPKNIIFKGHVPNKIGLAMASCSDCLLAPYQRNFTVDGVKNSSTEKWMSPLKIFEYMSLKKPIICSDFKSVREVLNDKNSVLVESSSVEKWIKSINKLKSDSDFYSEIVQNAYSDFITKYTWDKRAKFVLQQFKL